MCRNFERNFVFLVIDLPKPKGKNREAPTETGLTIGEPLTPETVELNVRTGSVSCGSELAYVAVLARAHFGVAQMNVSGLNGF